MEDGLYSNEYEDVSGRIIIDPEMRGSDEDVQSYSIEQKQQLIIDFMDWAESDNDWFANEMDDYFIQVFKDNELKKIADFLLDTELIDAVFQQIYKSISNDEMTVTEEPVAEEPVEAETVIDIEEDVKVGNIILEAGDKIRIIKEK